MPQSIRSILGKSNRVRKPTRATSSTSRAGTSPSAHKARNARQADDELFKDKLDDLGLDQLLSEDLTTRDVVQAMRYIRRRMFTPVPTTGFHSTRSVELLNYRLMMPPIVAASHINAVLHSPTAVEREIVELTRRGVVRKMRVDKGTVLGECLIESADLEAMVDTATLTQETKDKFTSFLRDHPTTQLLPRKVLNSSQEDELVRAGFLTGAHTATPGGTLRLRPEDRTTMTSLQRVSQYASGTASAVGGPNVVHLAGGGGGAPTLTRADSSDTAAAAHLRVAVPDHGGYLKLAEDGLAWLRQALGRTRWGEAPEAWLRERFEGGSLYGPRWKDLWGMEWEWLVGLAVGLGVVELFNTGSVGRGVRALSS
ncbi:hypothetical protein S40293_03657 [Stachybotrys chartarum IBT 40293]|nr:hypothetical protein S40293_03657 [Stachybotrys chartarum IBT 40293]